MLTIVRVARRGARQEAVGLGLDITPAQTGEIVAAFLGYESHSELIADTKDGVGGSLLEIAEVVVLNEPLAIRRAQALIPTLSLEDQKRLVGAIMTGIGQGIEDRTVFDDVQHLYDEWAEKEIVEIAMQADEVQALAEELEMPEMDATPSFTDDLWQAANEWTLYSYGTTKPYLPDAAPSKQAKPSPIYGLIRFRKAGRAGLMVDFADGGLDPRARSTH